MNQDFENDNPYSRYEEDVWFFGIALKDGTILGMSSIDEHFGKRWMRVTLLSQENADQFSFEGRKIIGAPSSRTDCLVNKDNILFIYELIDT